MCTISVITINRNNKDGLERTVKSVIGQMCDVFEYIVIDGDSTDGSQEVMERYASYFTYAVSEPDRGIYHAMNKGVAHAKGEYCLFLNSGDAFADDGVMARLQACDLAGDVLTGITRVDGVDRLWRPPQSVSLLFFMDGTLSHQASLIKRTILLKFPYDETKKIVSDWKFWVEALVVHRCTYRPIDVMIARYEGGGISSDSSYFYIGSLERDATLAEFFPRRVVRKMRRRVTKKRTDAILRDFLGMDYPAVWCGILYPFVAFYGWCKKMKMACGWLLQGGRH